MNRKILLCLAVVVLIAGVVAAPCAAQTLQKGVSVEMAATSYATPMPAADEANAWIVAVTRDGWLFFGTEKFTPEGLTEAMKERPRNRDQKLHIKADVRAPFADVEKVLQAGRTVWFESPVLLTSQPEQTAPGTIVPPMGLEVAVGTPPEGSIVVQVLDTGEAKPDIRVNGADVNVEVLRNMLGRILQNSKQRSVVVEAGGTLRFGQVAQVIDACRGAGARVTVGEPEL